MLTDIPESEIPKQLSEKYERLFLRPRLLKYNVVSATPYWAHQRVAKMFRIGGVFHRGDTRRVSPPSSSFDLHLAPQHILVE